MKKITQQEALKADKNPRTEQDEKFLLLTVQIMKAERISSERAFSLKLGRGPDFVSRIRRGIQSAPADAWDVLLNKYPEARNITNTNVMSQGGGQAVGTGHSDNYYFPTTLDACHMELEQHKRELVSMRAEFDKALQQVGSLTAILEGKEALLVAKDETITLLKAAYGRPH